MEGLCVFIYFYIESQKKGTQTMSSPKSLNNTVAWFPSGLDCIFRLRGTPYSRCAFRSPWDTHTRVERLSGGLPNPLALFLSLGTENATVCPTPPVRGSMPTFQLSLPFGLWVGSNGSKGFPAVWRSPMTLGLAVLSNACTVWLSLLTIIFQAEKRAENLCSQMLTCNTTVGLSLK